MRHFISQTSKHPGWLALGGTLLGISLDRRYQHYQNQFSKQPIALQKLTQDLEQLASEDEEQVVELHTKAKLPSTLKRTLANRFIADELTMFGSFVKDSSKAAAIGKSRLGFFAFPYVPATGGAANVILSRDPVSGFGFLMIVDRRKQKPGQDFKLNFPQGFTNHGTPQGLKSFTLCKNMDNIEEKILANKGGLKPYEELYSPEEIRSEGVEYEIDSNHIETAFREAKEETGEDFSLENIESMWHFGYQQRLLSAGLSNFNDYYVTVLRQRSVELKPAGADEIQEIHWISLSNLKIDEESGTGFVEINKKRYILMFHELNLLLQGFKCYQYHHPDATFSVSLIEKSDQLIEKRSVKAIALDEGLKAIYRDKKQGKADPVFLSQPYPAVTIEDYSRPRLK